jgi:hypothetical protein
MNRLEIAHTRREAVVGADNPHSLIAIFRRGHLAIKAGGAVYLTRCAPMEVVPRSNKNCTEETAERDKDIHGPHQLPDNIS